MYQLNRRNLKHDKYGYVSVNQRLQIFRELYPNWSIETKLISLDGNQALFQAMIKDEEGRIRTTGTSSDSGTRRLENAEESAVGRALGILGISADEDEFNNVLNKIEHERNLRRWKLEIPSLKEMLLYFYSGVNWDDDESYFYFRKSYVKYIAHSKMSKVSPCLEHFSAAADSYYAMVQAYLTQRSKRFGGFKSDKKTEAEPAMEDSNNLLAFPRPRQSDNSPDDSELSS